MTTKHNNPTLENVADDEPIFVLRARDVTAPDTIREWAQGVGAGLPDEWGGFEDTYPKIREARN